MYYLPPRPDAYHIVHLDTMQVYYTGISHDHCIEKMKEFTANVVNDYQIMDETEHDYMLSRYDKQSSDYILSTGKMKPLVYLHHIHMS